LNENELYHASLKPSIELLATLKKLDTKKLTSIEFIGECKVEISKKRGREEDSSSSQLFCTLERIRTDKTIPNSKYTLERTLVNIKENIQIEELIL
jgi:hypothetical protein